MASAWDIMNPLLVTCSGKLLDDIAEVYCTLCAWRKGDDIELSCMAFNMKGNFEKYLGAVEKMNFILYFASILDNGT